jgi:hypothetical protein
LRRITEYDPYDDYAPEVDGDMYSQGPATAAPQIPYVTFFVFQASMFMDRTFRYAIVVNYPIYDLDCFYPPRTE